MLSSSSSHLLFLFFFGVSLDTHTQTNIYSHSKPKNSFGFHLKSSMVRMWCTWNKHVTLNANTDKSIIVQQTPNSFHRQCLIHISCFEHRIHISVKRICFIDTTVVPWKCAFYYCAMANRMEKTQSKIERQFPALE